MPKALKIFGLLAPVPLDVNTVEIQNDPLPKSKEYQMNQGTSEYAQFSAHIIYNDRFDTYLEHPKF